jgi:hypothetical protein
MTATRDAMPYRTRHERGADGPGQASDTEDAPSIP